MNIAVYGLSVETERVLPELSGKFSIIGLLDGFRTNGELYGFPIISLEEAISLGIEKIIVVARPGSCKAIARRIGEQCKEHVISLLDIRGNNLLERKEVFYDFTNVSRITEGELTDKAKEFDVISFDLFDTLITRNVLFYTDVFEIIDNRLKINNIVIPGFVQKRIAAEKSLSINGSPRLCEIYKEVLKDCRASISVDELCQLEHEIDCSLLVERKDMISFLNHIKGRGKRIVITSDSYYSKSQIEEILSKLSINNYDELFVSCEYKTGKTQELFEILKEKVNTEKILHIGDDETVDIDNANRHGIEAAKINNGRDMFDALGGLGLEDYIVSLSDRVKVGMLIANIFNSPFKYENDANRIVINASKDIGYCFIGPMLLDFVDWFESKIKVDSDCDVLLGARDGFLIQKVYEILYPYRTTDYVLTSRTSAIRAGMQTVEDIEYVDSMKYSGSIEECLRRRFGIDVDKSRDKFGTCECVSIETSNDSILLFSDMILDVSKQKRANNIKYINNLNLLGSNMVMFDFVAKGTCQMYLERLVNTSMKGLYFLQLEPEFMENKNLDIEAFYTEEEREQSAIFENYYILETILTSDEPSVEEFDSDGNPVFAKETRTQEEIDCVMRCQNGILEYISQFNKLCLIDERNINKKLDEKILLLIRNVLIKDSDFLGLKVEDPFFNRMTDMVDVLG